MQLNTIQFVRALALVEGLRIMEEKRAEKEKAKKRKVVHPLDDKTKVLSPDGKMVTKQSLAIKALQNFTIDKGTRFASQFPDLDFPDETTPETPESMLEWEKQADNGQCGMGSPLLSFQRIETGRQFAPLDSQLTRSKI